MVAAQESRKDTSFKVKPRLEEFSDTVWVTLLDSEESVRGSLSEVEGCKHLQSRSGSPGQCKFRQPRLNSRREIVPPPSSSKTRKASAAEPKLSSDQALNE